MNEFTASNGVKITPGEHGDASVYITHGESFRDIVDPLDVVALREFFQAEADERLGRWRWPENPGYVVYPRLDYVAVVHEESGNALQATRDQAEINTGLCRAARAYFTAHPEPKPWHDAKPGEIWALGIGGGYHGDSITVVEVDGEPRFIWHVGGENGLRNIPVRDRSIDYGRRIWPEVTS